MTKLKIVVLIVLGCVVASFGWYLFFNSRLGACVITYTMPLYLGAYSKCHGEVEPDPYQCEVSEGLYTSDPKYCNCTLSEDAKTLTCKPKAKVNNELTSMALLYGFRYKRFKRENREEERNINMKADLLLGSLYFVFILYIVLLAIT